MTLKQYVGVGWTITTASETADFPLLSKQAPLGTNVLSTLQLILTFCALNHIFSLWR